MRLHDLGSSALSRCPGRRESLEPDRALLERAALAGGGFKPELATPFAPAGEVVTYDEPLWQRFLAAIVWLLLDLLMRRVRIFDRHFKRTPRRLRRT